MSKIMLSISEFINFEQVAKGIRWSHRVIRGEIEVTAPSWALRQLGYL